MQKMMLEYIRREILEARRMAKEEEPDGSMRGYHRGKIETLLSLLFEFYPEEHVRQLKDFYK